MIIFQILGIIILIWNFNWLHKTHNLPGKCTTITITVQWTVRHDYTHAGGSHKVHLRECPNTTKSHHSKQCKLMIIIVTLESALIQKYTSCDFKNIRVRFEWVKFRTPAISYDDVDALVNQYFCSNCINYVLACLTILRLRSVLANSRSSTASFHTGSVLFRFSV